MVDCVSSVEGKRVVRRELCMYVNVCMSKIRHKKSRDPSHLLGVSGEIPTLQYVRLYGWLETGRTKWVSSMSGVQIIQPQGTL